MNIAMFTNNYKPYIGGVPISIEHLAGALRQRGHRVYVFAPTYREQAEEEFVIRYPSFPVSIAKAPVPDVLTRIFEKKVKELKIDVIHVHHPAIVGNVALYLKKKYKIPVIYTYHTRYEQYLYYVKPLERIERCTGLIQKYLEYFCKRCDMLLAPTPGMRDDLTAAFNYCDCGMAGVCQPMQGNNLREHQRTVARRLGLDPDHTTGLDTAANLDNMVVITKRWEDLQITAAVSGGADVNALCAGDPAFLTEADGALTSVPPGTINIEHKHFRLMSSLGNNIYQFI